MKMKRVVSAAVALWMTLQVGAMTSFAVDKRANETYTDGVLAVINTDYHDRVASVSMAVDGTRDEDGMLEYVYPCEADYAYEDECNLTLPKVTKVSQQEFEYSYDLGDTKVLNEGRSVPLTCVYTGSECTVWWEESTDLNVSKKDCKKLGECFDKIAPKMQEVFGDKRIDTDKDGKIALFVYDLESDDNYGFFRHSDVTDEKGRIGGVALQPSAWIPGVKCDCLHLSACDLDTMVLTAVHEYQHYINYSYGYVGKNALNCVGPTEDFITEGFSSYAEHMFFKENNVYSIEWACYNADSYSMLHSSKDDLWTTYSMGYVFAQYMRTRYASLKGEGNGEEIFKMVMENRTRANEKNTLDVVAQILYPEMKSVDERCRQLLKDFYLAVYLNEPTGIHGFNGEKWAKQISSTNLLECWDRETAYLRSGSAKFLLIPENGSITITKKTPGVEIVYIPHKGHTVTTIQDMDNTYMSYAAIYEVFDPTQNMPENIKNGKGCIGWATTPNADKPDVTKPFRVTKDCTLYGVYAPAEKSLQLNETVYLSKERPYYFKVEVAQKGVYAFEVDDAYVIGVETEDGNRVNGGCKGDSAYFYLEPNAAYIVGVWAYEEDGSVYLQKADGYHVVQYIADKNSVYYDYTTSDVTVPNNWWWDEDMDGRNLLGWSTKKDAKTADYIPYETLTVSKDTKLYAVYAPAKIVKDNEQISWTQQYDFQEYNFTFVPTSDGQYRMNSDFDLRLYLGKEERSAYIDKNGYPMKAGETYHLEVCGNVLDGQAITHTLCMEKISDKSGYALTLESEYGTVVYKNKEKVTLPLYTPLSLEECTFLGWSENTQGYRAKVYKPGETITLTENVTLYPVWERAVATRADMWTNIAANLLRAPGTFAAMELLNVMH